MPAVILRADAARLPLPDASVDLVVTSPPYWSMRDYLDGGEDYDGQIGAEPTPAEYVANLLRCTREWMRVLKPSGSLWVNLGDKYGRGTRRNISGTRSKQRAGHDDRCVATGYPKSLIGLPWRYALGCVDELGLTLRAEVIWRKTNPVPDPARDRVGRCHEHLFHLVAAQRYYHAPAGDDGRDWSVWEMQTAQLRPPAWLGTAHHATFPMELPRSIIGQWCPPGGTVLDPFGGTGTTALVATALGRVGISVDYSADYCRLARWRTTDPKQLARIASLQAGARPQPAAPVEAAAAPTVMAGQLTLIA